MSRRGERIVTISEELETCIRRRAKKYESDLRVIATHLLKGYDGVGGVLVLRELQQRHPEEYKELKEITRKALLVAEDNEDYLPDGYTLDRSTPDLLVLNREDGTFVAVFSATGVSFQGILQAVKEDRRKED